MVKGMDVSFYEPNIDWQKVKQAGEIEFVYIRAGQGIVKDRCFESHRRGAESVGLPWGAYWFYDPRYKTVNPKRQAEAFSAALNGNLGQLPMVGDFELYKTGPWAGWRNWYDYFERLKVLHPGKRQAVYTGFYFWRDFGPASWDFIRHKYFAQYDLWLAFYPRNGNLSITPESQKLIPLRGWNKWTFWQYGDQYIMDGITGDIGRPANVDLNLFNGDLAAYLKGDEYTPPPPPPVVSYTGNIVAMAGVRYRSGPSTTNTVLGALPYHTTVKGDRMEGDWLHIVEPKVGWMATRYNGQELVSL